MRPRPVALTTLPQSPQDEQRSRMIKYAVMMGIRVVCLVLCLFTPGWWLLLPAIGAVVLPYLAVVVANAARRRGQREVERPGGIIRREPR